MPEPLGIKGPPSPLLCSAAIVSIAYCILGIVAGVAGMIYICLNLAMGATLISIKRRFRTGTYLFWVTTMVLSIVRLHSLATQAHSITSKKQAAG